MLIKATKNIDWDCSIVFIVVFEYVFHHWVWFWKSTSVYVVRCAIWYHLCNLKNVKNTHGGVIILVKLLKLTLLHGCFSRFLNCTSDTKSRNASHISGFANPMTNIFENLLDWWRIFFTRKSGNSKLRNSRCNITSENRKYWLSYDKAGL